MSFDLFVQSCIILKRMTDVFKRYDDDRDGYITLSFEEFLTGEFTFLVCGVEMGGFGGLGADEWQKFCGNVDTSMWNTFVFQARKVSFVTLSKALGHCFKDN